MHCHASREPPMKVQVTHDDWLPRRADYMNLLREDELLQTMSAIPFPETINNTMC